MTGRFHVGRVAAIAHQGRRIARIVHIARTVPLACLLGGAIVLAGCSTPKPKVGNQVARYDLGPSVALSPDASDSVRVDVPAPGRPLLKLSPLSAPASLDDDRIRYRLDYADIREARTYAKSRWSGTPSQLLTDRLRQRLSSQVEVLQGGDPERAPLLRIELIDFSQRFTSARHGIGVVSVRASLRAPWPDTSAESRESDSASAGALTPSSAAVGARRGVATALRGAMMRASTRGGGSNQWIAQHEFTVSVVCPSPDAAGAVAAISEASDKVAAALGDWVTASLRAHPTDGETVE